MTVAQCETNHERADRAKSTQTPRAQHGSHKAGDHIRARFLLRPCLGCPGVRALSKKNGDEPITWGAERELRRTLERG